MKPESEVKPNDETTISLVGEVNEQLTKEFFERFSQYLQTNPEKIKINISSFGGSIYYALAIHDLIRTANIPITTVAFGVCDSAAVVILQAGNTRQVGKNGRIILHPTFGETKGPQEELEFTTKIGAVGESRIISIIAERSGQSVEEVRKFYTVAGQHSFTAEEAREFGLVDEII